MSIYTVEQRREVPLNVAAHAGEKAVYVKLASGYVAWGFASDWEEAERRAVAEAKCLEPQAAKVIRNTVNSLFMRAVMKQKGWTKQEAAHHVTGWLTSGQKVSILNYLQPL
ncbi:hypothetical protein HX878_22225 [Pseudomonas veronii]|uniref:hypothetical protein n=1 Tax=Pseudomonas veronii TaxID=76761 RepID=UPI0015A1575A|nr:hypothetical protein [Pseudomonas veronii]NWD57444.1 hypothetical protein [Pseudomonas veronii]